MADKITGQLIADAQRALGFDIEADMAPLIGLSARQLMDIKAGTKPRSETIGKLIALLDERSEEMQRVAYALEGSEQDD